jgi:hypothetical protein
MTERRRIEVRLMTRVLALDYETADAAIAYAIEKRWLIREGKPPHSICLTDDGRAMARLRTSWRRSRSEVSPPHGGEDY